MLHPIILVTTSTAMRVPKDRKPIRYHEMLFPRIKVPYPKIKVPYPRIKVPYGRNPKP